MALEGFSLENIPLRQQALLFALALFAIVYFSYSWLIQPQRAEVATLEDRKGALTVEVEQGRLVESRLPAFRQEVQAQREKLRIFKETLPDEKETPDLMRRIQQLAVGANLNIKSFIPQQTVTREFYVDWPIQMTMEGNYHNLGRFFERVSRLRRLVNIGDVSIRALEDTSVRDRTIGATCTAITFVFLEEQTS